MNLENKKKYFPLNIYHPSSGLFVKDCNEQCNDDLVRFGLFSSIIMRWGILSPRRSSRSSRRWGWRALCLCCSSIVEGWILRLRLFRLRLSIPFADSWRLKITRSCWEKCFRITKFRVLLQQLAPKALFWEDSSSSPVAMISISVLRLCRRYQFRSLPKRWRGRYFRASRVFISLNRGEISSIRQ